MSKKIKEENISIENFKKKVKIEVVARPTTLEEMEAFSCEKVDCEIPMVLSKKMFEDVYDFCKKEGLLKMAIEGLEIELKPYSNMSIFVNRKKEVNKK